MKTVNTIEVMDRLKRDYLIRYATEQDQVCFTVHGIAEEFRVSVLPDECVVSTADWHEHFSDPEEMESFIRALFTGRAELFVTYRGDTPVSHEIQVIKSGTPERVSKTGALFFPFWKPKSRKKKEYKISFQEAP